MDINDRTCFKYPSHVLVSRSPHQLCGALQICKSRENGARLLQGARNDQLMWTDAVNSKQNLSFHDTQISAILRLPEGKVQ